MRPGNRRNFLDTFILADGDGVSNATSVDGIVEHVKPANKRHPVRFAGASNGSRIKAVRCLKSLSEPSANRGHLFCFRGCSTVDRQEAVIDFQA